jgi:hypothetical protein
MTSWRSYSQTLLRPTPSSPESDRTVKPFEFLLELEPHGLCNKYSLFGISISFNAFFISMVALFRLYPFAWANFSWKGSSLRVTYRRSGKGEGSYLAGGVGYPQLAHLRLLAARVLRKFARSPSRYVLGAFVMKFFAKNGTILGEGDLVFGGKAESPLTLFEVKFTFVQPTGASHMCKKTWKSFLRVEAT